MNTSRRRNRGFGTNTAGLVWGGFGPGTPYFTATESWDGTSWTTTTSLPAARAQDVNGMGTQSSGLAALGYNGTSFLNTSVEWTGQALQVRTITTS